MPAISTVASLWIGGPLGRLERLCLSSFLKQGHRVILFSHGEVSGAPDGVEIADAGDIHPLDQDLLDKTAPYVIADIFRLHLMTKTDMAWIDTDAYCWRPFKTNADGYLVGYFHGQHEINTGVLRMPASSPAVHKVLEYIDDPDFVPSWIRPVAQRRLAKLGHRERFIEQFKIRRSVIGPMALTHTMKATGEISHALHERVLYPVPIDLGDIYFNPHGGVHGWLSDDTLSIHFFNSQLRNSHKNKAIHPGSFFWELLKENDMLDEA